MPNPDSPFEYDVFLSHSENDKGVGRNVAQRPQRVGVKVWLAEGALTRGDSIPSKIEEGLERSRLLVLCMSAQVLRSDSAPLEAGTFRFGDPVNKERRFIPRLCATPRITK